VIATGAAVAGLDDLRGRVAAINHPDSHSGSNALRALVAPLARDGRFFGAVKVSGSHARSLASVAQGAADVAAVDCITHALLARYRPPALEGTRVLCRTAAAPAPPFVTSAGAAPALVARLRAALHAAIADPALAGARADLLLDGIEVLPRAAYRRIRAFARFAARHGCDPLGA
jgi:ABC-type phosphate/phosphonate transport system substrate-binding protein